MWVCVWEREREDTRYTVRERAIDSVWSRMPEREREFRCMRVWKRVAEWVFSHVFKRGRERVCAKGRGRMRVCFSERESERKRERESIDQFWWWRKLHLSRIANETFCFVSFFRKIFAFVSFFGKKPFYLFLFLNLCFSTAAMKFFIWKKKLCCHIGWQRQSWTFLFPVRKKQSKFKHCH